MKKPVAKSLAEWRGLHVSGSPCKIRSDAEVRAFVDELLKTETFEKIAAACQERFGPQRAPGKSAVHRYWQDLTPASRPARPPRRRQPGQ